VPPPPSLLSMTEEEDHVFPPPDSSYVIDDMLQRYSIHFSIIFSTFLMQLCLFDFFASIYAVSMMSCLCNT
jgi:hypothetical protein